MSKIQLSPGVNELSKSLGELVELLLTRERGLCVALVCDRCAAADWPTYSKVSGGTFWHDKGKGETFCRASNIHLEARRRKVEIAWPRKSELVAAGRLEQ